MDTTERDKLIRLEVKVDLLETAVGGIAADTKAIREQANRWKGALGVILGLGGVIGFGVAMLKDWLK